MAFLSLIIVMLGVIGEDVYDYSLFQIGSLNVYFIDLVILGAFVVILLNWQTLILSKDKSVLLPLAVLLAWMLVCIGRGIGRFSFSAIGESRIILPLLFFAVSYSLIVKSRSIPSVLDSLGKLLALSALGVLVMFLLELYVGHRLSFSAMENPEFAYGFLEDVRGTRILGTLQTFTAGVFFIFVCLNLLHKGHVSNTYKVLGFLMPLVMLVSMNRAAIISLGAGMAVYSLVFTKGGQRLKLAVITSLTLITIFFSLKYVFPERYDDLRLLVTSVTNPEMEPTGTWLYRKQIEIGAIETFLENPIAGEGFGGYWQSIIKERLVGYPPHNQYLILLAKTGTIGFTLFIFIILAVIRNYLQSYKLIPSYARPLFDTIFIIVIASVPYGFAYGYIVTYGFYLGIFAGILHRTLEDTQRYEPAREEAHAP
jgi:O-antigen ligase